MRSTTATTDGPGDDRRRADARPEFTGEVSDPAPVRYVVSAGHAFDGERLLPGGADVLVDDGVIVAVTAVGRARPPGWPVVDTPGGTLLPGLIDSHVHLVAGGEPDALAVDAGRGDLERAEVVRRSLRQHLAHGVTTVRDLGDTRWAVLDRTVAPDEPAVLASGPPITTPGGHCSAMGGVAVGADQLRRAVQERYEHGAHVVKVMVSGGAMTAGSDLLALQYDTDDLRVVVEQAHRLGLPVTAHAHSVRSVEVALAAGVDGIEHCTCLGERGIHTPPALVDALAARRVPVCPTFGRLPHLPPSPQALEVMARTGMTLEARLAQVGVLHAAGVPVTAGSDAGIHPAKPHGVLPYAVAELVRSGLAVEPALAAATAVAADACGLGGRTGRLRGGLAADLLVVDGALTDNTLTDNAPAVRDPTEGVAALTRPRLVALRGRLVRLTDDAPPARS